MKKILLKAYLYVLKMRISRALFNYRMISRKTKLLMELAFLICLVLFIFNFEPQITGKAVEYDTQAIIITTVNATCNQLFRSGWNLASVACLRYSQTVNDTFGEAAQNLVQAHEYNAFDATDPWKAYKAGLPQKVIKDLSMIDRHKGYWLYFNNDTYWQLNDDYVTPNIISLNNGWNLVGYPTLESKPVNESLQGVNYRMIYYYNATEADWKEYSDSLPAMNDLTETQGGHAYWIQMNDADTWVIMW